jgi:hypothetical protein
MGRNTFMPHGKSTGRDAEGRFAPGNSGGHISRRLQTLALQGDVQAIKLVLSYAIGKPEAVEAITERVPARRANGVALAPSREYQT